jgi:hypothetical protein
VIVQEFEIFFKILLVIAGAIVTLGGASAVISRLGTPYKTLKGEVDALKGEVKELKGFQNSDHKELRKVEEGIEKICKCTLAITDHELTGNSVDKLRAAKDEMQDYLIQK